MFEFLLKKFVEGLLWLIVHIFFKDVHTRGQHRIPKTGPIIFVAAPHANQFVDPLIIINNCKREVGFLIAQKSLERKDVGGVARAMNSIGVIRPQDIAKAGKGTVCIPDPNQPTIVEGTGTEFSSQVQISDSLTLPKGQGTAEVIEIISDTKIVLKRPFQGDEHTPSLVELGEQRSFKILPKIDQSEVYSKVFERLADGGCIGIFPEGGSHDRTELLPLKAGVTLMALGAMAANPGLNVTIIPCGLNYFHAHKFRSQACVFFGEPMSVPQEYVDMFKEGGAKKRVACSTLLDAIYQSLTSVTIRADDYENLQVLQAVRRLYQPKKSTMSTSEKIALTIRIQEGYDEYKHLPEVQETMKEVLEYNKCLKAYGLKDHQVDKIAISRMKAFFLFFARIVKFTLFFLIAIPGLLFNFPVGLVASRKSISKAKEAVKSSNVKIAGRDVLATWKVMTALGFGIFTMLFYTTLCFFLVFFVAKLSLWLTIIITIAVFFCIPLVSYVSVLFTETGVALLQSLRPLWYCMLGSESANELVSMRRRLQRMVIEIVDVLGPRLYPNYNQNRYISEQDRRSIMNSKSYEQFFPNISEPSNSNETTKLLS